MSRKIIQIINDIRSGRCIVRPSEEMGKLAPMVFSSTIGQPCTKAEQQLYQEMTLPNDLICFWSSTRSADLFVDQTYGQWGLRILDPKSAIQCTTRFSKDREDDYKTGDLVIGRFVGDSDLLILRCDNLSDDFGQVVIGLPIDHREDWYNVSSNFGSFMERYMQSRGDKFWSIQNN